VQFQARYLSQFGGRNVADCVKRIIPMLLDHNMQCQVNFSGSNMAQKIQACGINYEENAGFKTLFGRVVNAAVSHSITPKPTESSIEKEVANFLRRASDRQGGRERRRKLTADTVPFANPKLVKLNDVDDDVDDDDDL
jgi:hypothetical protein